MYPVEQVKPLDDKIVMRESLKPTVKRAQGDWHVLAWGVVRIQWTGCAGLREEAPHV